MNLPEGYELEQNTPSASALPAGYELEKAPGALESAGRAFVNNLPLGGQIGALGTKALSEKPEDYTQALGEWNQEAKEAKAAHPVAYGLGAVGGAAAPAFIPGVGGVLKAAPVAGNALLGAGYALGNTNLTQAPEKTLKEAGMGLATGAALGKAGEFVGNALTKAANVGKRIEANATSQVLDLGSYGTRKLAKGKENPEDVMLRINKELQELMPDFIKLTDDAGSKYGKILTANNKAGDVIGEVVDSVTKSNMEMPEVNEAIRELKSAASKYNELSSSRNMEAKAELLDAATRLQNMRKAGGVTFKNLAELKSDIGSAYHDPNLQNHGVDQAYKILTNKIDNILDRASVSDPALKPSYDKAKQIYRLTSELLPAMKRGAVRDVAGVGGGLTNTMLGAGAIFGHPLTAGVGYAAKTAGRLAAPDIGQNLAYKTVNALKGTGVPANAGQATLQELNDYLMSKYGEKEPQQ